MILKYKTIWCPVHETKDPCTYRKCSGNPVNRMPPDPCPDCPIDWSKVERIAFCDRGLTQKSLLGICKMCKDEGNKCEFED
jgi:hypothetical protein